MKLKKTKSLGIFIAISSIIAYVNLEIVLLITAALISLALYIPKPKISIITIFCTLIIGFNFLYMYILSLRWVIRMEKIRNKHIY